VYAPDWVTLPWPAGTDQVTAVFVEPVTVAVKVCVPLGAREAVFGETETLTACVTVTVAVSDLEESAWLVAVTV
jgi:hypothetical protein